MPGWKVEATKRVNLPDDIADGLWISIYHPKLMPFEPMKQLLALAPATEGQESAAGFDLDKGRDLATSMIRDWNLPGENGQILPLPSIDASVWDKIPPMPVIMAVFGALGEGVAGGQPDPNLSNGSASS